MWTNKELSHSNEIVLRILESKDSLFSSLLLSSLNVILYRFIKTWEKTPIEGSLYIYKRKEIPSTALLVLNRKNPKDFLLYIDQSVIEVEEHRRFVIIKKAERKELLIYGLWFYDTQSSINTAFLLTDQINLLSQSRRLLSSIKEMSSPSTKERPKKPKVETGVKNGRK